MSERDELANILNDHFTDRDYDQGCRLKCGYDGDDRDEHLADAILAAGYRKVEPDAEVAELRASLAAMAIAWDEGFDVGWDEAKDDGINDKWDSRVPNPYGRGSDV